jgi:hypothetical protein
MRDLRHTIGLRDLEDRPRSRFRGLGDRKTTTSDLSEVSETENCSRTTAWRSRRPKNDRGRSLAGLRSESRMYRSVNKGWRVHSCEPLGRRFESPHGEADPPSVHSTRLRTTMDDILRFLSVVKHDPAIDAWLRVGRRCSPGAVRRVRELGNRSPLVPMPRGFAPVPGRGADGDMPTISDYRGFSPDRVSEQNGLAISSRSARRC